LALARGERRVRVRQAKLTSRGDDESMFGPPQVVELLRGNRGDVVPSTGGRDPTSAKNQKVTGADRGWSF
jgi:hypothetical protein